MTLNDKKEIYSSEYTVLEHGSDAPYGGSISNKYESDSRCIRTNGETFVIDPVDYIDVDFKDEEITEKLEALNK